MIRLAAIRLAFLLLAGTIAAPAWSQALTNPAALTEQARAKLLTVPIHKYLRKAILFSPEEPSLRPIAKTELC